VDEFAADVEDAGGADDEDLGFFEEGAAEFVGGIGCAVCGAEEDGFGVGLGFCDVVDVEEFACFDGDGGGDAED
jgi:hypothetical protein